MIIITVMINNDIGAESISRLPVVRVRVRLRS